MYVPPTLPTVLFRNNLNMYTLEDRKITFDVPVETAPGVINNSRDHFEFTFNQTFDVQTKQDAVFDSVARPIIDGALEGFNGAMPVPFPR